LDPGNPNVKIGFTTSTVTSILEIRGDRPAFYEIKDVPHGVLRIHLYNSKSSGVIRELTVYTPPGYDERRSSRYPVLYLLHGANNDHYSWERYGRANEILDNLLSEKAIEPCIVVMPLGYGGASADGQKRGPGGIRVGSGNDLYERDIIDDIIPFIDKTYRTKSDREHRAIVGFSMGGGQSSRIGLKNLDAFSYIGVMSAGMNGGLDAEPLKTLAANPAAANKRIKLLWIACGKDDFAMNGARSFSQNLTKVGIKHTFLETEGAHHWRVWRRYLRDISPLLFR
jgi:enterochelin esterase-like enzyme